VIGNVRDLGRLGDLGDLCDLGGLGDFWRQVTVRYDWDICF